MAVVARLEWLARTGSTNDIVAGWLRDGTPEVCIAVADEQTAGRGRAGRSWTAPPRAALLLSAGFRPAWLASADAWRLAAVVSLAMAGAAEATTGLAGGTIRLKWPNDLVAELGDGRVGKLGGVLGETDGLGTDDPRAVVGIGVNAGWRREAFPPELAASMTSLAELAGVGDVDRKGLVEAFVAGLEPLVEELRAGRFAGDRWRARQLTSGRTIRLEWPDGTAEVLEAIDVDPASGALLVRGKAGERVIQAGEIHHLRVPATDLDAVGV